MGVGASIRLRHGPFTVYLKPLEGCPALEPYLARLAPEEPCVWLDSARMHPVTGRWSMLGHAPWLRFETRGDQIQLTTSAATQTWRAHPLEVFQQVWRRYRVPRQAAPHLRAIGLMGFLGYELNRWIESLPPPRASSDPPPEMLWWGMGRIILLDHQLQRSWLVSLADPHAPATLASREARAALDAMEAQLSAPPEEPSDLVGVVGPLQPTCSQAEYEAMVRRALEAIRAGEIFQANVAQRFTATWRGSPVALYRSLRAINPSPFACFVQDGDLAVVSCSPERLVRIQDGRIESRPIAGTRPRGLTPQDDALKSLELLLSEKERAEHIMLVDLERNDLGRVCRTGTVTVDELMGLEDYSHVIHIVSNISGSLARGRDPIDVIRAVFPGGTITGCPKVRCMQILRELEPVPRGLYTGSLGTIGFDGTMDLNIAIRTLIVRGQHVSFHIGAGVVADSTPEAEYHETLTKGHALVEALHAVPPVAAGTHDRPR